MGTLGDIRSVGAASLSATQSFLVTVNPLMKPQLSHADFANGQFVLQVDGDSGPDYQIQVSTNLVDWDTAFNTNSPTMPFRWTNGAANNPLDLYRVLIGP